MGTTESSVPGMAITQDATRQQPCVLCAENDVSTACEGAGGCFESWISRTEPFHGSIGFGLSSVRLPMGNVEISNLVPNMSLMRKLPEADLNFGGSEWPRTFYAILVQFDSGD